MVVKSEHTIDIPQQSFPTLLFGSPEDVLPNDKPYFLDHVKPETHYLTRHTFRLWSQCFAAGLQKAGLNKGDRVVVFSTNNLFYPVVFMGVIMAGGIFSGCNASYTTQELAHQIKDADPKYVLSQGGDAMKTCLEAAKRVGKGHEKRTFMFDSRYFALGQPLKVQQEDQDFGRPHWSSLIVSEAEGGGFAWDQLMGPNEAQDTVMALNYSSGTTGLSKGVEITHGNYVANILQYNNSMCQDMEYELKYRSQEQWLCFLPLYHAMAQMIFLGVSQYRRTPVYIMEKFDFLTVLKNVEKYRISHLQLVPPVVVMLAKSSEVKKFDLSSVRSVGSGAAPLSREVSEEVEKLWPKGVINIHQGWGMTEATCSVLGWDAGKISTSNSVGWPTANSEAKIMSLPDEHSAGPTASEAKEVGPNEAGELWVRGPQIMKGYWKNPKATAEILTPDRWLRTGDIGYYDNENKFFISGRLKELIKVKGMQVAPAELDGVCLESEGVADAAVVGVTINGQEHPRAYIVLKDGVEASKSTAERITTEVNSKLSQHKRITGGLVFVSVLPKNPSGKILRRFLRERAQKEVQREQGKIRASL
ncbi:4-coumarate-CoA ligase, putative [Talaromyces stipitatus ATCC 10500]|uniref:4-coumarate-CoA ligase, putative n=1 Tax=Talaromyces stipitatus (strain ATCC 10500 / CBS 375.48 / QM 6759 / NRRL 1006) TaxID=441959 RepID=B8MC34_TALSN|nr:4-coumarate-CoA ligase, putative [Talaromyces stipitatus ATCC 10500]EED18480.1 4-coumarate-CoA ligase, putative [Talaromyces stipitatus ATCC 10500]